MEAADGVLVERKRVLAGISVEADDIGVSGAIGAHEGGRVTAVLREASRPVERAGEVVGDDADAHGDPVILLVRQLEEVLFE